MSGVSAGPGGGRARPAEGQRTASRSRGLPVATTREGVPRSRAPPVTASARPTTASTVATTAGEVQPRPVLIARPPAQAPPALAMLNAAWLEAEASVGALRALFITIIWSGVVVAKPTRPSAMTAASAVAL